MTNENEGDDRGNLPLPHPKTIFDLWGADDTARLNEMVARRQALLRREAEQEATR